MSNLSFLDLAFSCRIQKLTHLRLFQTFANEKYYNIRVFTFEILSKIFVEMPKFTVDVSAKQKNWFIHSTATCIQFYEKTGSRLVVFLDD